MPILSDGADEGAGAHQLGARCEVRAALLALLGARHELPAAVAQETMVRAGNELAAICQRNAESRLDDAPMREDPLLDVAAIPTLAAGAIDLVANLQVPDASRAAIRHQHRRVAVHTVDAAMLASPIGIDRAVEADVGRVVVRNDGAGALDGDLRLERPIVLLVRRPAVVEAFARDSLEAPLHEGARAAHMEGFALAVFRHGFAA